MTFQMKHADGYNKKAFGYVQYWMDRVQAIRSALATGKGK